MKEYTFTEYNRKGAKIAEFSVQAKNYDEAVRKLNALPEYQGTNPFYYVIFTRVQKINE